MNSVTFSTGINPDQAASNTLAGLDRLNYVEGENRKLKDEDLNLKMFKAMHVKSKSPATSTPKSTQSPKSITPKKLKQAKKPDFDLEAINLDSIGSKLHTSCYDLARCLMKRSKGTLPVPSPPSSQERTKIEGFFDLSKELPSDSASLRIQQREVVPIEGNSKIDGNYWGLSTACFGLVAQHEARLMDMNDQTLMAIYWPHTKSLRQYYKRGKKGAKTLVKDQEKNTKRQSLRRKSVACQLYLQQQGVHSRFVEVFDASSANLDNELILEDTTVIALAKITTCVPKRLLPSLAELKRKDKLNTFAKKKALRMAPPIFDMIDDFNFLLPQSEEHFHSHPAEAHIDTIEAHSGDEDDNKGNDKGEFGKDNPIMKGESDKEDPILKIEEDEEML
ncbi:hypothetical protein H4Q26_008045 [Puccinia striiformis f. sp. tritici PST-130]|nr:hypothetical protein H4Q26_008045 [Puccinia striiformis f. sp. tritici PST-130]